MKDIYLTRRSQVKPNNRHSLGMKILDPAQSFLKLLIFVSLCSTLVTEANASPEIGPPEFRISHIAPSPEPGYTNTSYNPAVAYGSQSQEFYVVWQSSYYDPQSDTRREEIFGQRINALTGEEIGEDTQISSMGVLGSAAHPEIVYNSTNNEYLVVWTGNKPSAGLNTGAEVFARRIDASTGAILSTDDIRVSFMTTPDAPNSSTYYGVFPHLAWNSIENRYFIIWYGPYHVGDFALRETEIWGQQMLGGSDALEGDFIRLSHTGGDGEKISQNQDPRIAYSSLSNQYLVIWTYYDNIPKIYGQMVRHNNSTGELEERHGDFGISTSTSISNRKYPNIVANDTTGEYFVVFQANIGGPQNAEIFARRVSAHSQAVIDSTDIKLSDLGDGGKWFPAREPYVVWNSTENQYLVTWEGSDTTTGGGNFEVFGQYVDATTVTELGINDFPITNIDNSVNGGFFSSALAYGFNSSGMSKIMVAWEGSNNVGDPPVQVDEVWGKFLGAETSQYRLSLSIDKTQITEGDSDATAAVTATLSEPSPLPVTAHLKYTGNIQSEDYTASAGNNAESYLKIIMPAGVTSGTVNITINDDTEIENSEILNVRIAYAHFANISENSSVTLEVIDDDAADDTDGDGILNADECPPLAPCPDWNGDGVTDHLDPEPVLDDVTTILLRETTQQLQLVLKNTRNQAVNVTLETIDNSGNTLSSKVVSMAALSNALEDLTPMITSTTHGIKLIQDTLTGVRANLLVDNQKVGEQKQISIRNVDPSLRGPSNATLSLTNSQNMFNLLDTEIRISNLDNRFSELYRERIFSNRKQLTVSKRKSCPCPNSNY